MEAAYINLWGFFAKKEEEDLYLKHSIKEIQYRNRLGILVGGFAMLLVGLSDFSRVGNHHYLFYSLLARFIFFLFTLGIFFLFLKPKRIETVYKASLLFVILFAFLLNSIIFWLNPDKNIDILDLLTLPICTLIIYVFLIIPSMYHIIGGAIASTIYLYVISLFDNTEAYTIYVIFVILLVINFMGFYITRFLHKSRRSDFTKMQLIEKLNGIMKDEIEERKAIQERLQNVYLQITESLRYAGHLQMSMLPDHSVLKKKIQEDFIYYKPCDIVSGDFYWFTQKRNRMVIAVADCTGHGIPAAFMSIVGITMLEEIVEHKNILNANEILDALKENVIKMLKQTGKDDDAMDGMNITLCSIDFDNMELQFSGAFHNLLCIRNNEILEFKGDKMPISYYNASKPHFSNHIIPIQKDDCFYMYSDGITDQFGGSNNKKFSSRRLKECLFEYRNLNMKEQKEMLLTVFDHWSAGYSQTDDILLMGFRV